MEGCRFLLVMLLALLAFHTSCQPFYETSQEVVTLSRRKRYIVFPEGSTFSVAFCVTWKALTEDLDIYTIGLNWAIAYELPNQTVRDPDTDRFLPPFNFRRRRRELYNRLEAAMDAAGLNGRTCIKRALCEAAQKLLPGASLLEEILRILFSFPLQKVEIFEPADHHVYDAAHRKGLSDMDCVALYPGCVFSLVDMVLGT